MSRQVLNPFLTMRQRSRDSKERRMRVMFLEGLGDYKCDTGMSVENVLAVVDIKTLEGRFIVQKFSTGWATVPGVVKIVEKKKSVAGQFTVK